MLIKSVASTVCFLVSVYTGITEAASCLSGSCHKPLTKAKFLHGPIAAEQAGARAVYPFIYWQADLARKNKKVCLNP